MDFRRKLCKHRKELGLTVITARKWEKKLAKTCNIPSIQRSKQEEYVN